MYTYTARASAFRIACTSSLDMDLRPDAYQSYFVDLFVRPSNNLAVSMYEKLGYDVYRTVEKYYSGGGIGGSDEDGWGESSWSE